ncbi:MAG: carbonic anhydrase [Gammaproteobacteria bacterium]|jgi:carbonic anhydrase
MKTQTIAGVLGVAVFGMGMYGAFAMDEREQQMLYKKHHAKPKVEWGYTGKIDPSHWGELSSEYALCAGGKNQSPVDLANVTEADLPPIEFNYSSNGKEILNNGHSIQVNYAAGSSIVVDGHEFHLLQFHFHSPSENLIDGKSFPMEGHLVHADENDNLAVVAIMFEEGETNSTIAELWKQMPGTAGDKQELNSTISASALLPDSKDYYYFNGSLTTPPCTEGVMWMVMEQPVSISESQVAAFTGVIGHPNNRPVQPVNARRILED